MSAIDIMGTGCLVAAIILIWGSTYGLAHSDLPEIRTGWDSGWDMGLAVGRLMLAGVTIWIIASVVTGKADVLVSVLASVGIVAVLILASL